MPISSRQRKRAPHYYNSDEVDKFISTNPDKNESFVLRNCIVYLRRLLDFNIPLDKNTLNLLAWILGPDFQEIEKNVVNSMTQEEKARYESRLVEADDAEESADLIYHVIKRYSKKRVKTFISFISKIINQRYKSLTYRGISDTEKKIRGLEKMFNLSKSEIEFASFLYIVTAWTPAQEYFVDYLSCHTISGRRYLRAVLQMTEGQIGAILGGTIMRIELCEIDKYSFSLSDDFVNYFLKPSDKVVSANYFRRVSGKTIPLESHLIDSKKTDNVLNLLSVKRESPSHILLYGAPGTGKTSYAHGLVQKLGVPAYEILKDEENKASKRRTAIMACLNITNCNDGSVIIVDEADNILNTQDSWFSRGETQDKGWLNQFLEEPEVRMLWITNKIDQIDPSVLRRFSFSLHFETFNQRQRVILWEAILRSHRVKRYFNADDIKELSNLYPVSAAIIDLAIKKATDTAPSVTSANFKETIRMNLAAHISLTNGGFQKKIVDTIEKQYSIDGLNVEGDLPTIMHQIEAFDKFLRQGDKSINRNFNLLFYGPPGTGKSEYARYIAKHLEKEIICKRASDIISRYVGDTEKNISLAFEEAEADEAILIIDEADSFLYNRSWAERSWEISHTNEFLTQMERFRGMLICTTNMLRGLDSASIRRFNHKIKFDYLRPEGNVIFYQKLLASLANSPLNVNIEDELRKIRKLTPGDFRVIRDRYSFYKPQEINHQTMVEALSKESNIKQIQRDGGKRIGF
jgi:SpoVK/Ycf46/Vps4 family AAA+-type ATPase